MKAVVFHAPHHIQLTERAIPQPAKAQVLLRIDAAGICMTDHHIYHGHFQIQPPRILGHEIAGAVVALGEGVDSEWLGQRVGVQPAMFCGHCSACQRGLPELCANFACLGNTHDGGYAEFVRVNVDQLARLDGLSAEEGVWLEPLACVIHAMSRVRLSAGQKVLIAGAGTYGKLLTQVLTRLHGASVAVVDPNPERIQSVMAMGADIGWQVPRTGSTAAIDRQIADWSNGRLTLLIDTSGQATAIERLIRWTDAGGTVLLFGVSSPQVLLTIAPASIFARELTLTASAGMAPAAFESALDVLKTGKLELSSLIQARVELADVPALFTNPPSGKIIILPH